MAMPFKVLNSHSEPQNTVKGAVSIALRQMEILVRS